MDEHDRLFHPHWQGLHPPPPRVHPFLTRSRRLRRRRRAQQLRSRKSKASSVLRSFTDDVPDCQSNLASSPSPSVLSPPLMHRYLHCPHSESQWAEEGNGKHMYVEGRTLTSSGEPISGVVIETWEADDEGEQHPILSVSSLLMVVICSSSTRCHYDTQLTECPAPNCRVG